MCCHCAIFTVLWIIFILVPIAKKSRCQQVLTSKSSIHFQHRDSSLLRFVGSTIYEVLYLAIENKHGNKKASYNI